MADEVKPFQVWGIDEDGDAEAGSVYLAGFEDHLSAELCIEQYERAGYTNVEIREVKACPSCSMNMATRLVGSHEGSGAKRFWECPACKHNEPAEEI